ncbi:AsmA-like C-terminal region-containing protein [Rubellicoccus peritrichatus]|uniref:AsmA-like C-terminal region-containing protein n=1 Tax=Rubellicoccus peritrichatus TaxID=3080537 RepID=A0AAQ3L8M4_9BACT|nr:AsmA-like C-terminal region-containing protein [Puniceicoccus sp. CR14]WOO40677.1 AsmA-like C-terminal region-containing protein [Puniceicoccus sp. CR14]
MPKDQANNGKRHFKPLRLLISLFNVGLLIALVLQIVLIVWLLPNGNLTLPKSLLDRINSELESKGLALDTSKLEIDLRGYIVADDVKFGFGNTREPAIEAKRVLIGFRPLALLIGEVSLDDIRIIEGNIFCPPVISPTGTREAVIKNLYVRAERQGHWWKLDRFHFKAAGFKISAAGPIPRSVLEDNNGKKKNDKPLDLKSSFEEACRYIVETQELTKGLEDPIILIELEKESRDGAEFRFHYQSRKYTHPSGLVVGPNVTEGIAELGVDKILRAKGPATAEVFTLQYGDVLKTGLTELRVTLGQGLRGVFGMPQHATAFVYDIESMGLNFDGAFLTAQPISDDRIQVYASIKRGNNWLDTKSKIHPKEQSAHIHLTGRWDPKFFLQATPFAEIKELPQVDFSSRPRFQAKVKLGKDWTFEQTWMEIDSGPASYESLKVESLYAQARMVPGKVELDKITIATKDYTVKGQYWQNLKTNDYRFLIRGHVNPMDISFIVDEAWWDELWKRFDLTGGLPQANMDIRGRYGDNANHKWMYGWAQIPACTFSGAAVDSASTYLYQIPTTLNLMQLEINDGTRSTLADLQWRYIIKGKDRVSLAFTAHSTMPLKKVAAMIGPEAEPYESLFTSETPPTVKAAGVIYGEDSPLNGEMFLNIDANFPKQTVFEEITFDRVAFDVFRDSKAVQLNNIDAGIADGILTGTANLNTPEKGEQLLDLDLTIKDAKLLGMFTVIPQLAKVRDGAETDDKEEDKGNKEKSDSKEKSPEEKYAGIIDIDFKGSGQPGETVTFKGSGDIDLRKAHLGELHLFGGLSRLLGNMGIGFGTVDFTKLKAKYSLRNGTIYVPDVAVSGATAQIDANGYYNTQKDFLDFVLTLNPVGAIDTPVVSQVLTVLKPLTNTVEVKLTGTLEDPEWKTSFGLLRIVTGQDKVTDPDAQKGAEN